MRTLIFFTVIIPHFAFATGFITPVRQAVDVYNAVGSNQRMIGFMKIGASEKDLRYLAYLNGRISQRPLPRAFLAGNLIYFKGLDQPLTVVDLKQKLFSFNGKRIKFDDQLSIEARINALERIVYPRRSAFILWNWIFPNAVAASGDPNVLTTLHGMLAVGGIASSAHCLAGNANKNCAQQFMGTLAAVGAVGGLRGKDPANKVFCSPDFRGGQKFVIAGEARNKLAISEVHGEVEVRPSNLNVGSPSSINAAGALLASCKSPNALSNLNIALAYPSTAPALHVLSSASPAPARAPAAVREYVLPTQEEQGGTAR